ncbi:MAG: hypothetical protein ABSA26_10255 [Thermoguttaceae bacterium]
MTNLTLQACLSRVRRRVLAVGWAAGIVWAMGAALAVLLTGVWLDLLWELSPQWRVALLWAAGITATVLVALLAGKAVRFSRDRVLARRLDRATGSGGIVLTGVELDKNLYPAGMEKSSELTAGLARRAVSHAAEVARRVSPSQAVPLRTLRRSLTTFTLMMSFVGVAAVCLPGLVQTQWNRFFRPFNDVPPYSPTRFEVTPGNVPVIYGKELEIRAKTIGPSVDQAELVIDSGRGQESPLPMFPEPGGAWRAVLAKVTEPAEYFVRANRARSEKYHIRVITLPRIENVRLRIASPDYANRPPYEGPLPKEGVAGLPGTKVRISIRSNRPLSGGDMEISARGKKAVIPMKATSSGAQEAVGEFEIASDGKFECRVIDVDGQTSEESFSGGITLLADERPFIRLTQPPKMSLATPNAVLPVAMSAEDDCGITRLELFRNLNESRYLSKAVGLPPRPPRRADAPFQLPLASYGLQPGDEIKLFGRVEDNDPAGAKGAESTVATVRIISQEDFEQMMLTQKGIEALMAKYQSAQRRLEKMAGEIEDLQNKIKKLPPGEPVGEETRKELRRLEKLMREQAAALDKLSKEKLPFDADANFAPQLDQVIPLTKDMAKELEKLAELKEMSNEKLAGDLGKMADLLSSQRKSFDQLVSMPLEKLEAVFRLMVDERRFIALAQWQRDLAERLSSLKGRDGQDDPALKARLREMEQEQRQIREALGTLLSDIEEHVERLPNADDLEELRQSAAQFVKDVRASGANEAMAEAESALMEFAATRGYEKAKKSADILEQFIKKCDGNCPMQGECEGHIFFQPMLGGGLGNTLGQLLGGMGTGNGFGMGMGGFSPIGLYGGLPIAGGVEGWMDNANMIWNPSARSAGTVPSTNPDATAPGENQNVGNAAGVSEGETPMQYRREVGRYFQRVSEETGEVYH